MESAHLVPRATPVTAACSLHPLSRERRALSQLYAKMTSFLRQAPKTVLFRRQLGTNVGLDPRRVAVFGSAVWKGQNRRGVELAPQALRHGGRLMKKLATAVGAWNGLDRSEADVRDYGDVWPAAEEDEDVSVEGLVKSPRAVGRGARVIGDTVRRLVGDERRRVLQLGGDHSCAIGSVLGHAEAMTARGHGHNDTPICVLWVDAHADIHTPRTSTSGHLHGCAVSFHLRELEAELGALDGLEWIEPWIDCRHLAYIALRDVDDEEQYILDSNNIAFYGMDAVDRLGIEQVTRECIERINPRRTLPLHLSFDIDALDPLYAPSTGTPVAGGLTLREGLRLCEIIGESGMLSVMDLVEVNPLIGSEAEVNRTLDAARRLVASAFGSARACNYPDARPTPSESRDSFLVGLG